MDFVVYPALRRYRINFTPIKRIACGFGLASLAMIAACVTQVYIYRLSPCGTHASDAPGPQVRRLLPPVTTADVVQCGHMSSMFHEKGREDA